MTSVNEALSIARKEVTNIAQYNNAQEFANKCFGTEFTSCAESLEWYTHHNRIVDIPNIGDQVFIDNSTGIVELISGSTIYTIELDTDIDSAFYGLICRKQRNLDSCVFCRPEHDSIELINGLQNINDIQKWLSSFNTDNIQKVAAISIGALSDNLIDEWKPIRRGHAGMHVQAIQAALICAGYSCGKHGADGYFGDDSVDAVKRFQKDNKMICNGIVGKAVASKLFKGMSSSTDTK